MWNAAEFHLALNHLPIIVPIVGIVLLFLDLVHKSITVQRIALGLILFGAVISFPVFVSGNSAEAVVKNYPDVGLLLIRDHKNAAWLAIISSEIVGILSLILLLFSQKKKPVPNFLIHLLLALALTSSLFMARAAHFGGKIRHEEIRIDDRF